MIGHASRECASRTTPFDRESGYRKYCVLYSAGDNANDKPGDEFFSSAEDLDTFLPGV